MAPFTLYDASIVPFIRTLRNLSAILKKGEAYADEKGISHAEFLEGRLIADMNPLTFQIQTASNTAKNLAVRVAGAQDVVFKDDEKTFADLQARIAKTIEYLEGIDRKIFDGKESYEFAAVGREFTGLSYVTGFGIPNFFFHAATAYGILRSKGVEVGKADWLGTR